MLVHLNAPEGASSVMSVNDTAANPGLARMAWQTLASTTGDSSYIETTTGSTQSAVRAQWLAF